MKIICIKKLLFKFYFFKFLFISDLFIDININQIIIKIQQRLLFTKPQLNLLHNLLIILNKLLLIFFFNKIYIKNKN